MIDFLHGAGLKGLRRSPITGHFSMIASLDPSRKFRLPRAPFWAMIEQSIFL